ncbi:hypothetical protein VTL71DRAFT_4874 [Oculimacula yallundae]|uniref:Uncharacterized protein n=1 Tax=Oculimacula yallundae TaxID=86028 RepID=A0ABR4C368_9HELO
MSKSSSRKREKTESTTSRRRRHQDEEAGDERQNRNTVSIPRVYGARSGATNTANIDFIEDDMKRFSVGDNYDPRGSSEVVNRGVSRDYSSSTSLTDWQKGASSTTSPVAGSNAMSSGSISFYDAPQRPLEVDASDFVDLRSYSGGSIQPNDSGRANGLNHTSSSYSYLDTFTTDQPQQMSINGPRKDYGTQRPEYSTSSNPPLCLCEDQEEHLCGVIIFPSPDRPSDGRIEPDKGKGKRRAEMPSSSSGSKSGSGSGHLSVKVSSFFKHPNANINLQFLEPDDLQKGPDGAGCGPIVLPGITPSPRPRAPWDGADRKEREDYEQRLVKWKEAYESWKHITCPCKHGYFDEDGKWVSGGDVRNEKEPRNPRWESSNGIAPDIKLSKIRKGYRPKLYERNFP